ncbi:3-isopropylmalate dehydratase small subunit [Micromonospora mirobrigensis]|uniref:3-isopropylmalate dehydratase small subunit n=1 Tax=Micromonospora mirobrigensis TaxID=262898 RepID=A0A1C4V2K8_9ACTN|nr:3-isopropylmalate dehydratase small subunit [Micromonospora mirobrigensis]SCE78163.1 3-isopropylmalate/(R)-2-methylmalate dehydratase small subunit [Micromonospora mirobrigensis]
MEKFVTHTGVAAPLPRSNVNTDDIVPARFLKTIRRTGFADALFANWRYLGDGQGPNPEFELNQPAYAGATILVAGPNFGCGSSREHAPWSLREFGFRCIIAPSFADIFYNNCFNSSILPVVLEPSIVDDILATVSAQEQCRLHVDLPAQTITLPDGRAFRFEVDAFKKEALLQGLDSIDWTLSHRAEIQAYEQRRRQEAPWLFADEGADRRGAAVPTA